MRIAVPVDAAAPCKYCPETPYTHAAKIPTADKNPIPQKSVVFDASLLPAYARHSFCISLDLNSYKLSSAISY